MANTFETAEVVFPSGVKYTATRILTSGGEPGDRPIGWVTWVTEADGQTWSSGSAGPTEVVDAEQGAPD